MSVDDMDVLVIGAGLAGLRCAGVLAAAGRDVHVWEASDGIGGRVRTDVVDGAVPVGAGRSEVVVMVVLPGRRGGRGYCRRRAGSYP